jgi:hypothetical protein
MVIFKLSITLHTIVDGSTEGLDYSSDWEMTDIVGHPGLDHPYYLHDLTHPGNSLAKR